jgi:uncharacterized membrane protein YccC
MAQTTGSVLRGEFKVSSPVFRHALRAAFAITAAIAVTRLLDLSHSVWVPISVMVVMRPSLGGTLHVSWKRLVGTTIGAFAGVFITYLHLPVPVTIALALFLLFFIFYFKGQNYIAFTAILTADLVLILGAIFSHTWQGGAERMLDTFLGISIGLAASFLIWPNFARKGLRQEMGALIAAQHRHFCQLRRAYFSDAPETATLLAGRIKALTLLETCTEKFTDAAIEPGLRSGQRQGLVNLVDIFTRIHRTLTALSSIVNNSKGLFHGRIRPEFETLMDSVETKFSELEKIARTGQTPQTVHNFNAGFSKFMFFLKEMRSQGEFERFSLDSRNNSSAFIQQINRLGTELERAANRIHTIRNAR